jgi:imidazolonepropionase
MKNQKRLIKNIGKLIQVRKAEKPLCGEELNYVPVMENAWLAVENGRIADLGTMDEFPGIADWTDLEVSDANGCTVMPAFVDCHTHIVYAGSRQNEFVMRLQGKTYQEIAEAGGGILNSVGKLRQTPEDDLYESAVMRLRWMLDHGTGAVEIKSGYGLDLDTELKMLRVIRRIKEGFPHIPIRSTFLGAHAVPEEYKNNKAGYVEYIIKEMIPAVAYEKLADFVDVFCENGYFSFEDTVRILEAGLKYGLIPKVHAEQLSHTGGIEAGVKCGAISVDHLEFADEEDIMLLKDSKTIPVLLPGAQFFLGLKNPPVKEMLDAGLPIAIGSDFNPGSCPSGNMGLMMALGCIVYKLTPAQSFNACTVNSAFAMGVQNECGSIFHGARANLLVLKQDIDFESFAYHFGMNLFYDKVMYL